MGPDLTSLGPTLSHCSLFLPCLPGTCEVPQNRPGLCNWRSLNNPAEMWFSPCCLVGPGPAGPKGPQYPCAYARIIQAPSSCADCYFWLQFWVSIYVEIYRKWCSPGHNKGKTQLRPSSLTTHSTFPSLSSSHSTISCECGKKCQEERQEGELPEWTKSIYILFLFYIRNSPGNWISFHPSYSWRISELRKVNGDGCYMGWWGRQSKLGSSQGQPHPLLSHGLHLPAQSTCIGCGHILKARCRWSCCRGWMWSMPSVRHMVLPCEGKG